MTGFLQPLIVSNKNNTVYDKKDCDWVYKLGVCEKVDENAPARLGMISMTLCLTSVSVESLRCRTCQIMSWVDRF